MQNTQDLHSLIRHEIDQDVGCAADNELARPDNPSGAPYLRMLLQLLYRYLDHIAHIDGGSRITLRNEGELDCTLARRNR